MKTTRICIQAPALLSPPPVRYKRDEYPYYIEADPRVDCFPHEDYNNMRYGPITYEQVQEISTLPGVSSYNVRYMTGGICDSLIRGFDYYNTYDYTARLVVEGTLKEITTEPYGLIAWPSAAFYMTDIEILAGDAELENLLYYGVNQETPYLGVLYNSFYTDELRDYLNYPAPIGDGSAGYNDGFDWGGVNVEITSVASNTYIYDYDYLNSIMEPGGRYVLILRFSRIENEDDYHLQRFYCSLYDFLTEPWCKAVWDVTDAPENYLELEEYAPLKECIEITQQDLHTFDVVYTNDMSVIKQVARRQYEHLPGQMALP